jgi:hypothetical protein
MMMMKTLFAPVAPAVALKPSALASKSNKPNALNDVPALKTLQADTLSFGENALSNAGFRSGVEVGGAGTGGTWLRLKEKEFDPSLKSRESLQRKIATPKDPEEFVQIMADFAKESMATQKYPRPMALGFPGQFTEEGHVALASALPEYEGFPLIPRLKEAIGYEDYEETRGYSPIPNNDITMQLYGLDKEGEIAGAIGLGTGTGNGLDKKGRELGHVYYTKVGNYPLINKPDGNRATYQNALCDLPLLLQHEITSILADPKASVELKNSAKSAFKNRDLDLHPLNLEDWKRLHQQKHPLVKRVLKDWETSLVDVTTNLILAHMPDPKKIVMHLGGTVIDKLLPEDRDMERIKRSVSTHDLMGKMYASMPFLRYDTEAMELTGAAKVAYEAFKSLPQHSVDFSRF